MSPVPVDFGWRYIGWFVWSNLITILMIAQAVFASLSLATDMLPHTWVRGILIANAVATAIIAQVKRASPNSPEKTA